jgi:dCMP deaminase
MTTWDDTFMNMAIVMSKRSKDPVTQVGAIIVDTKNRILGAGYNGLPRGCQDCDYPWGKDPNNPQNNKALFVIHAECNAIHNCPNQHDLEGGTMYVTLRPCHNCAKDIIQSGIKKVIYRDEYSKLDSVQAADRMFRSAGILLIKMII